MGQYNDGTPQYPAQQPQYTQQPTIQPQMTVGGGGNKNAKNIPYNQNGQRDWSNGLCGCFGDVGTCLTAWFCPCIVYSANKSRLEHLERHGTPHPDGGDSCGGDCWIHCLLTSCIGAGFVLQIGTRGRTRERYRIEGSGCGDCMAAWCCTPCELTQESREIELEEDSFGKA